MRYLIVAAHPDDEVLGAGGTIFKLISEGNDVAVAIMSYNAEARNGISETLATDVNEATSLLGVKKVYTAAGLARNSSQFDDDDDEYHDEIFGNAFY